MTEDERIVYLGTCWEAFIQGRGVTKDDAEAMMADLATESGYYTAADIGTPDSHLRYREGARSIFARILLLSGVTRAAQERMRRAATDDLIFADEN